MIALELREIQYGEMRRKSHLRWLLALAVTLVIFAPLFGDALLAAENKAEGKDLFNYDYSADFDLKEGKTETRNDVLIRDIDYSSFQNRHGRIKAYLVKPKGDGPFAGVVFFHWLGESKSNRTEFLDEAVNLARQGTVSLLIQGFFPWSEKPSDGETDRQRVIDQTIEVRRAIDLLLLQPGVDQKRIAFVGHDYGAMFGAITAGLEHRAKAYVLMAGVGTFSDWSLKYWPKTGNKGADTYRRAISVVDPAEYVRQAAPSSFLFQFSTRDKYISRAEAESFFEAASGPKAIKWYETDHQLGTDAVSQDRTTWLAEQLSLTPAVASKAPSSR